MRATELSLSSSSTNQHTPQPRSFDRRQNVQRQDRRVLREAPAGFPGELINTLGSSDENNHLDEQPSTKETFVHIPYVDPLLLPQKLREVISSDMNPKQPNVLASSMCCDVSFTAAGGIGSQFLGRTAHYPSLGLMGTAVIRKQSRATGSIESYVGEVALCTML